MRILKDYCLLFLFSIVGLLPAFGQNAQWVNPFIGTGKCDVPTLWGNYGGTFPGATAPWGVVQLTPETSVRPSEVGYYYEDAAIRSFSCLHHLSGYPNGSTGRLHFVFWPEKIQSLSAGFVGRAFSHADEKAEPGYYSVSFADGDRVEMTAGMRCGLFRYYSSSKQTTIVLSNAGAVEVKDKQTLHAALMHSVIRFQQPFESYEIKGNTVYLHFSDRQTKDGLLISLSVSSSGFEASEKNRKAEGVAWNFEQLRRQTYELWNKELACVEVDSSDKDLLQQFYTALYHAFLYPNVVSDAGEEERYGTFSPWDTFRTLHPLLSLLKPERQKAIVRTMMEEYELRGNLVKGPMSGLHTIPIIVDAYVKDAVDVDPQRLWKAMLTYQQPETNEPFRRDYLDNGFVKASLERSVSITTEYAYDDWVLGHFAEMIHQDGKPFLELAFNYRNLFDVSSQFMLPREGCQFMRNAGELGFQESNKWTASYFVPHNMNDLIHMMGGDSCYISRLQYGFDTGKIHFDNEPVFHYPYLFTWGGRPDLTVKYVHQVLRDAYRNSPGGLPGNDDLGSMSSWFVLSAMGVFPACPGSGEYLLSEPLFDKIRIKRSTGGDWLITKSDNYAIKGQLPSVFLGNKPLNRWFVSHKEWSKDATIRFESPDPTVDCRSFERPYSLTKGKPDFRIQSSKPMLASQTSGVINTLPFAVKNQGTTGSYVAEVHSAGKVIASKHIWMEAGEEIKDTIGFTLYQEGKQKVSFSGKDYIVEVSDSVKREQPFKCTSISLPSLLAVGDSVCGTFVCKNIAGKRYQQSIPLWLDNRQIHTIELTLESGEEKTVEIPLCMHSSGFYQIRLLNQEKRIKAYSNALETCLLDLDYSKRDGMNIFDQSGFGNHGTGHGNLRWSEAFVETTDQAFITFPASENLMQTGKMLTLLTWIAPQVPVGRHAYADFFTKGDYTLMKMEGPNSLIFFAGGWGRGMCEIKVPDDWYTAWHQIAGVCTGHSLKIYLDGKLMQEIQVAGDLESTEVPWNLGRNAEMPFSRFSAMRFSKTRIYGAALSDQDIHNLYMNEKDNYKR